MTNQPEQQPSAGDDQTSQPAAHPHEVFDLVGGKDAFIALVDEFYRRVETDSTLRAEYPEDLGPGKHRLALFLTQYFSGVDYYSSQHGHPRLRMRHAGFQVTPDNAQRWATHMSAAVKAQNWPAEAEAVVLDYVARATPTLVNRFDDMPQPQPGLPQL